MVWKHDENGRGKIPTTVLPEGTTREKIDGRPRKLGRDIIKGAKERRRRNMRMVEEEI